ncbi:hypothetical protein B0H12DRAFT_1325330 [Mycena haematopus]|nr:hypothetical protein B0H12DRAFT_1325330 [Mycena haematopus]
MMLKFQVASSLAALRDSCSLLKASTLLSSINNSCPQCLKFKYSSLAWSLSRLVSTLNPLKNGIGQQLESDDSAFKVRQRTHIAVPAAVGLLDGHTRVALHDNDTVTLHSAVQHPLTLMLDVLAFKSYAPSHLLTLRFGDESYWADVRKVMVLPTRMFARVEVVSWMRSGGRRSCVCYDSRVHVT